MQERLQKIISRAGITSRREAEKMILLGAVKVNGKVVTELGVKCDLTTDEITVNGKKITAPAQYVYILLNKPKGYISTVRDERNRRSVLDLVPEITARIYPVGRLDADTEGLLLLTNDGTLTNALLHPSGEVYKTYSARVTPGVTNRHLQMLADGVKLEDGVTAPATVRLLYRNHEAARVELTIHEGRNREVRRMFQALGYEVLALKRIAFAGLALTGVKRGEHRELTANEVRSLYKLAGLKQEVSAANDNRNRRRRGGTDGRRNGSRTGRESNAVGKNAPSRQKNSHHRQRPL